MSKFAVAETVILALIRYPDDGLGKFKDTYTAQRALEGLLLEAKLAEAKLVEAEARIALLTHVLGFDGPWPVTEVLRRLASATDHLLDTHSCDAHGYEGVTIARDEARNIAERIDAIAPESSQPQVGRQPQVDRQAVGRAEANWRSIEQDRTRQG